MNLSTKSLPPLSLVIWGLTIINLVVVIVVLAFPLWKPQTPASDTQMNAAPATSYTAENLDEDALNPYGKSALKAGLPDCALPMNQLAERALVGHKVGGYRFPTTDKTFGSMSMEVITKSGGVAYMTFNMSQPAQGQCIIAYEAVSQWDSKCSDVVKNVLKEFIPTRMLGERIALLTHKDNENRKVFTMPVGKGCLATEKEIINFRQGETAKPHKD